MEMKQIRMGIVGAGTWGQTHASIYAEHVCACPVAICDSREERAGKLQTSMGLRRSTQIITVWPRTRMWTL